MRVWYGRLVLVLVLGLGLMAGCGGQGGNSNQGGNYVDASLGTYNGSNLGMALLVSGVLGEPTPPEGVEVQVKDSQGDTVFSGRMRSLAGGFFYWWLRSRISIQSGTYTISATFPGGLQLNKTVQVDAAQRLEKPSSVTLNASRDSATVQWEAVPGAVSYEVELWELDSDGNYQSRVSYWYTKDTSLTFNLLDLTPGGNYRAVLFALNADLTRAPASVPAQFNASFGSSAAFTVQSTGGLRMLDLPEPSGALEEESAQGSGR